MATIPATAQDQPLSAIDWLTDTVDKAVDPTLTEPPASTGAGSEAIEVTSLDGPKRDAVGLLPSSVTGLPADLWGSSASEDLVLRFDRARSGLIPATQDMLLILLLAEVNPPGDSDPSQTLFHARIDTLIALGAVDQAQALLQRAGPDDAESFARWLDVSLLTGTEGAACAALAQAPDLAPSLAARIYCLARGGDWNAAAVTLETARALGQITSAENEILTEYLDPDGNEDALTLAPPARPDPLMFRLYEAAAEPIPTTLLPLAYAHSDLRSAAGWKAQIEAAERLARAGVLDPNRLMGLYTERQPAASGGVWDRVAAVQALEAALDRPGRNTRALSDAILEAWTVMEEAALEPILARLFAGRLSGDTLPRLQGDAAWRAFELGLLTNAYEAIARRQDMDVIAGQPHAAFLRAVAIGDLTDTPPVNETEQAIADGFLASGPDTRLQALLDDGKLGEAILTAIRSANQGAQGDLDKLASAIALFRAVGLEETARKLALQTLILVEDA